MIGDGDVPDGAADGAVCVCDDNRGIPHLGLTYGMWEPAGLFEIVRSPGCSPILGGTKIEATGDLLRGSRGGTLYDKGDRAFYHYHMWKFPLLAMLELFTPTECVRDGGVDIDLLYFSELDPTWVYDELAFFANPGECRRRQPGGAGRLHRRCRRCHRRPPDRCPVLVCRHLGAALSAGRRRT